MAKSIHFPFWMALLLVVGLCSLTVYSTCRDAGAPRQSAPAFLEDAGHVDDLFLPVCCLFLVLNAILVIPVSAACLHRTRFSLAPILPPPNSHV